MTNNDSMLSLFSFDQERTNYHISCLTPRKLKPKIETKPTTFVNCVVISKCKNKSLIQKKHRNLYLEFEVFIRNIDLEKSCIYNFSFTQNLFCQLFSFIFYIIGQGVMIIFRSYENCQVIIYE